MGMINEGQELKTVHPSDIIIVNHNSTDYLLRCLNCLYESSGEFSGNIFIEDNASVDRVDRLTDRYPAVHVTRNPYNKGFSRAVNDALQRGHAPYVVILNPDTFVTGDYNIVIDFMAAHPEVGVVGPKIVNANGKVQGSARLFPSPMTAFFGRSSILSKLFPKNRMTRRNILTHSSNGSEPVDVDWVSGACMFIRRQALSEVGLFDERFFMYWEDADLCQRMRQSGWRVVYFPKLSAIHLVGGSSSKKIIRSIYEFHKSSYNLYVKHHAPPVWFRWLALSGLAFRCLLKTATVSIGRLPLLVKKSRRKQ